MCIFWKWDFARSLEPRDKFLTMKKNPFGELPKPLADFQSKVGELVRSAPTADIERHMKGALNAALGKMEVVTREDFEIQAQMLARALEKLAVLEKRLAALEQPAKHGQPEKPKNSA